MKNKFQFIKKSSIRMLICILCVCSCTFSAFAQEGKAISGSVVDDKGEAVIGASVVVKGTTNANVTDVNGKFTLSVSPNAILVISYIGYNTREIAVKNQTEFSITLTENVQTLDDVVVVGYGTQKKANLTGAVASVKSELIAKSPVASTINALAGRLPGLVLKQENGAPGFDAANINIRNFGSALIIVDGAEQSFNNIDANEIESITILKDASAAIYGARAGNGVILVKTKRGRTGKPTVTLNSSLTGQSYATFHEPVNAGQYATMIREVQINSGVPEQNLRYSEEDIAKFFAGNDPAYPNTNWMDIIMQKWAPQTQHNLSIEGGNENVQYFTFLSYLYQDGMDKGGMMNFDRYNVRSNIDMKITSQLTASLDLSAIREKTQTSPRPGPDNVDNTDQIWMDLFNMFPTLPSSFPDKTKVPRTGMGDYNPLLNYNEDLIGYNRSFYTTLNGALTLDYKVKPIEGLGVKFKMNYKQWTRDYKKWRKQVETYDYDPASEVYSLAWRSDPPELTQEYTTNRTITGQLSLYYDRVFAEKHSVNALLLFEAIDYASWNLYGKRINFMTSALDQMFAGNTADQVTNGSTNETGRESLVARVNYGYMGKYLLEGTLRYDGSPNFPKDKRWGLFPSISAGWRISEESFIKDNVDWLHNLKIRGGVSRTGWDNVAAYQYLTGFTFSGYYVNNGSEVNALQSTGLANPNITWETMTLSNLGLDVSVFQGKLYAEADIFQRLREGILATRTAALPNTFGASLPRENINSQVSRGFELVLGTKGIVGDVGYDISGNVSYARTKWKHYEEVEYTDPDDIRQKKRSGNWVDAGYLYKSDGLFTSQEEIDALPFDLDGQGNRTLSPGDIRYVDINGDGVLNWRDQIHVSNEGTPHYMFGLNLSTTYKGFDFSMLFQGAAQYNLYLQPGNVNIDSDRVPYKVIYEERWTPKNNDRNAIIPRQKWGQVSNSYGSDFWCRDASYLRLKNINLGYTFAPNLLAKAGIESLRLYLTGTNLFTFSDVVKYGFDPESQSSTTGWQYPVQKTVTAGLNIKF